MFQVIRTLSMPLSRTRKTKEETISQVEKSSRDLKLKYDKTIKLLKSTKVSNKFFLLEGKTLVKDALLSENVKVNKLFYVAKKLSPEWLGFAREAFALRKQKVMFEVSEDLMSSWSDVKTSQGVIAFAEAKDPESMKVESSLPFTLVLDNVREPGNMGTIIRTAACIGCERILLTKGSVQPWSSKVVRASMGGVFQLPVHQGLTYQEIMGVLQKHDYVLVADSKETSSSDLSRIRGIEYTDLETTLRQPPSRVALVIGNEAIGISDGMDKMLNDLGEKTDSVLRVKIPLSHNMESLNCSIAFGVLGYEIRRLLLISTHSISQVEKYRA